MDEEASESCFCSETLDIILGMVSGVLKQTRSHVRNSCSYHWIKTKETTQNFQKGLNTPNTVAPSCPWSLLSLGAPCSAPCSSLSSSPAAAADAPPAWPSGRRRTWKESLGGRPPHRHGSAFLPSRTSASCSGCGCRRRTSICPRFHLERQLKAGTYIYVEPHMLSKVMFYQCCTWVCPVKCAVCV